MTFNIRTLFLVYSDMALFVFRRVNVRRDAVSFPGCQCPSLFRTSRARICVERYFVYTIFLTSDVFFYFLIFTFF